MNYRKRRPTFKKKSRFYWKQQSFKNSGGEGPPAAVPDLPAAAAAPAATGHPGANGCDRNQDISPLTGKCKKYKTICKDNQYRAVSGHCKKRLTKRGVYVTDENFKDGIPKEHFLNIGLDTYKAQHLENIQLLQKVRAEQIRQKKQAQRAAVPLNNQNVVEPAMQMQMQNMDPNALKEQYETCKNQMRLLSQEIKNKTKIKQSFENAVAILQQRLQ